MCWGPFQQQGKNWLIQSYESSFVDSFLIVSAGNSTLSQINSFFLNSFLTMSEAIYFYSLREPSVWTIDSLVCKFILFYADFEAVKMQALIFSSLENSWYSSGVQT